MSLSCVSLVMFAKNIEFLNDFILHILSMHSFKLLCLTLKNPGTIHIESSPSPIEKYDYLYLPEQV